MSALVTWIGIGALLALALIALAGCATPRFICFPVETDHGPAFLCGPLKEKTP